MVIPALPERRCGTRGNKTLHLALVYVVWENTVPTIHTVCMFPNYYLLECCKKQIRFKNFLH